MTEQTTKMAEARGVDRLAWDRSAHVGSVGSGHTLIGGQLAWAHVEFA
jgi:hypothetical protein